MALQEPRSQRMRSVIFLLWKASEQDMPFESFYYLRMDTDDRLAEKQIASAWGGARHELQAQASHGGISCWLSLPSGPVHVIVAIQDPCEWSGSGSPWSILHDGEPGAWLTGAELPLA